MSVNQLQQQQQQLANTNLVFNYLNDVPGFNEDKKSSDYTLIEDLAQGILIDKRRQYNLAGNIDKYRVGRILLALTNATAPSPTLTRNLATKLTGLNQAIVSYNTVSNAEKRVIHLFLLIYKQFTSDYDKYTVNPSPNALFDEDEYNESLMDVIKAFKGKIVKQDLVNVVEIINELEMLAQTKKGIEDIINDIRTIKMAQSTAPSLQVSQAPSVASVQTITAPDLTTLRQQFQKPVAGQQFDIEKDVKDYNNYVLYQLANKQSIDTDFINEMKRKYPFIFNDAYERNVLGYNGIINSGIVRSNINVDYKDLVLPIPSYVEFAKQKQSVNIQTEQNIQNVLSRGYQIIANKGKEVKDEFLSFKQKGDNQFEGKYIQPKLKGSFSVTYNPRYNEYKIVNRNYPTGFVKKPFDIYQYINSLVKKQEMKKQAANPPYMPRVTVAYQ